MNTSYFLPVLNDSTCVAAIPTNCIMDTSSATCANEIPFHPPIEHSNSNTNCHVLLRPLTSASKYLMKLLLLTTTTLLPLLVDIKAQPIVGESNLVPNGSFELLSKDEGLLPANWGSQYMKYSLFWRQFHWSYLKDMYGDINVVPPLTDRIYFAQGNNPYDPVCCSTSDLFSKHITDCIINGQDGSIHDIPENWYGTQDLRLDPPPNHGRYAGLYYRLNKIENSPGGYTPNWSTANGAVDYWREYIEVELTRPLQAGKVYNVSYYVSLGEVSFCGMALESRLSINPYRTGNMQDCWIVNDLDGLNSHVNIPETIGGPGRVHQTPIILNRDGWDHITYQVTAHGGEKYLTIGNFQVAPTISTPITPQPEPYCEPSYYPYAVIDPYRARRIVYLYIDDVSVSEQITCECGPRICFLFTRTESSTTGKCCYKVSVVNGHRENLNDPLPAVCDIHSLVFFDNFSNQELFQWSANATEGPLSGDGIWREIGTLCVNTFPLFTSKSIRISIRGPNGIEYCSQVETIDGCGGENECGCKSFRNSVKVTATSSQGLGCCYQVSIDASMIENCTIGSVYVYEGNLAHPNSEIVSGRYPSSVPSNFSGILYTFCPPSLISQASAQAILLQFRDVAGNPICEVVRNISCDCRCGSTTSSRQAQVSIEFEPISSDPGQCCYNLRLRNDGVCRFLVNSFKLYINDNQPIISPVAGWTSSGVVPILTLSRTTEPLLLSGDASSLVGTVCIPTCVAFNPGTLRTSAVVIIDGEHCEVPMSVPHVPTCGNVQSCDDFVLSVEPMFDYPTSVDNCCRYIKVRINNCLGKVDGLRVDILDHTGKSIDVEKREQNMYSSTMMCTNWFGQIFTVILKRADGTILCTKNVTMPFCLTQSSGS